MRLHFASVWDYSAPRKPRELMPDRWPFFDEVDDVLCGPAGTGEERAKPQPSHKIEGRAP